MLSRNVTYLYAWIGFFFLFSCGSMASGQTLRSYVAGTPAPFDDPAFSGWQSLNTSLAGPISNDPDGAGGTKDAWQVIDNGPSNPLYSTCFDNDCLAGSPNSVAAMQEGWRFSTTARLVNGSGNNSFGTGLVVWLNNRGYVSLFDFTSSGALSVTIIDSDTHIFTLSSGHNDPAAYHDFSWQFDPSINTTGMATFLHDGVPLFTTFGQTQVHANVAQWGDVLQRTSSSGTINFNRVELEILQQVLPGDYNGNGQVDAADYTVWRDTLGSRQNLAADGNGNEIVDEADYTFWKNRFGNTRSTSTGNLQAVPEPSTSILATLCLLVFLRYPIGLERVLKWCEP